MTNRKQNPVVRRAARALALTPAILVITATGTAFADAPEIWKSGDDVSPLYVLLVLGAAPAGLFLLITLLVYVPSMSRGEEYQPGLAWRNEPEWFGGPRGGVEATETKSLGVQESEQSESGRGGASARW